MNVHTARRQGTTERGQLNTHKRSKMEDVCPNEECTEKALHCDLPKHRQECPQELVMCKYAYFGCDERGDD